MKAILLALILGLLPVIGISQNIDYEARIYWYWGGDCGEDGGIDSDEEHTWYAWIRDDVDLTESSTGCVTTDNDGAVSLFSFFTRNRNNVASTELITRIDAWEDDAGNRCDFDVGDQCRVEQECTFVFENPLEYDWTQVSSPCGTQDYNIEVRRTYRYVTTPIPDAVENSVETFTTGGSRPFWGSIGTWGFSGQDCATSGTIADNETSSFSTTVNCKSQVSFRWKVSSQENFDFLRVLVNGVEQQAISGSVDWTQVNIDLPFQENNTIEWRYTKNGSVSDGEDRGFVDQISFTDATVLNPGTIAGNQTICINGDPTTLSSVTDPQSYSEFTNYQWQFSLNGVNGWTDISGETDLTYNPPAGQSQTRFYRRRAWGSGSGCGLQGNSNSVAVTIDPNSTAPTIANLNGSICPNTTTALTASGGIAGMGSTIEWYSGPDGTGANLGSGLTLNVSPITNTTYYVRREGICNDSDDESIIVDVKDFVYANAGVTASADYCTDNAGWHHFFNSNDEIIFSVNGDLSGATSTPIATITNNGNFYVQDTDPFLTCFEQREYEMKRSWDLNFAGVLNPPYAVRFYYPPAEKTAIETAAANYITANSFCNYTYEYANPLGFYWFKNPAGTYSAPTYDQPLHLTGTNGSVNSVNYAQLTGITSFSGGSGGVTLQAINFLPVELISFSGYNQNRQNYLNWSTLSEMNNDKFEIERSSNPQYGFEKIGQVEGAGKSTETLKYQFIDDYPLNETNYYRLRQVDFNGEYEHSSIIEIKNGFGNQFKVYPNVATKELTVNFDQEVASELFFVLSDVTGRKVIQKTYQVEKGNNSIVLDVSKFNVGPYFLSIYEEEGVILGSKKIIKR